MKKIALLLAVALLAACQSGTRKRAPGEKPILTVTIEPVRYFTEAIAGDSFTVVSLVPRGTSPETYDPTPQQLMELAKSDAYLRIGYIGFELTWADKLADNAPHMPVFNLSDGIRLIYDDSHHHHHGEGATGNYDEAEHHHHHGGVEPHVWNSAQNACIIADNILYALCSIDGQNASAYKARHDSLVAGIERTDSLLRRMLADPEADWSFMIYHPALSYFARDYGLHQISIEEGGKEPSPAQLKKLIDLCRKEHVRVIFVQPEFDRRNAELIAEQTGAKVVPINPLAYEWEEEMIRTAKALTGK